MRWGDQVLDKADTYNKTWSWADCPFSAQLYQPILFEPILIILNTFVMEEP